MIEIPPTDLRARPLAALGPQPIAIAAAALLLIIAGIGTIFLWRIATGASPEQERVATGRQVQARVAQTSEQLVERTKGLELTQQQSIDQLQALQDQLAQIEKLVSAQRSETKKLSEQVGEIGTSLDSLRQSFAQAQPAETAERPAVRAKPPARVSRGKAGKPRAAKSQRRSTKPRR
ncbi:hypothetical protein BJ123_106124 [Rhodopseudomonas thermotolerans]|uniref:Uncharacterized protein n=2 Tax=Rhodopseudomonas TaxID=1073 RepID=A0A336JW69_9BRAD|nr:MULTISPECIES: hypothetical protein [Rhodopseudomonas]RED37801.1 hypothetical protein BJ125_106125 [Rhodopseudomonas pentothenatexigens]REG04535.1 hypothetical protein BJ123_106124 [Rhodopseudomonas thermotolerans]SSW90301.1 hypothetical protein SAMN05892882_106125 [Rhodopseudomonas pentothenatexigens]